MTWSIMSVLKWTLPGSLIAGWLVRAWIYPSYLESAIGIAAAFLLLALYLKRHIALKVLWHEEDGVLSVTRPWIIEASIALLFTKIPIGIDLSKSAGPVLTSMNTRFANSKIPAELRFFVCRPLSNQMTIAGFMVTRKFLRLKGPAVIERLRKILVEDRDILDGIMRAMYHHVPIVPADLDQMIMINSGGTRCVA
jgi:hypothetical protein